MRWQDCFIPAFLADNASDAEIFAAIRAWRDNKLEVSDWTQLPDAPVDKAAWAAYRQELRDLPSQNEDPKLIVFPKRP